MLSGVELRLEADLIFADNQVPIGHIIRCEVTVRMGCLKMAPSVIHWDCATGCGEIPSKAYERFLSKRPL